MLNKPTYKDEVNGGDEYECGLVEISGWVWGRTTDGH